MTPWRDRILAIAGTAFGLGYAPVAPGTAGTLGGVAIFVLVVLTAPAAFHTWLLALMLLAVCVLTIGLGPWAERYWHKKDPRAFVLDEVAGFLLAVLLFRVPNILLTVAWVFVCSRVLDVVKPPPARQLERLPGGWGVLADDLCASLYAAVLLHILAAFFPVLFRI